MGQEGAKPTAKNDSFRLAVQKDALPLSAKRREQTPNKHAPYPLPLLRIKHTQHKHTHAPGGRLSQAAAPQRTPARRRSRRALSSRPARPFLTQCWPSQPLETTPAAAGGCGGGCGWRLLLHLRCYCCCWRRQTLARVRRRCRRRRCCVAAAAGAGCTGRCPRWRAAASLAACRTRAALPAPQPPPGGTCRHTCSLVCWWCCESQRRRTRGSRRHRQQQTPLQPLSQRLKACCCCQCRCWQQQPLCWHCCCCWPWCPASFSVAAGQEERAGAGTHRPPAHALPPSAAGVRVLLPARRKQHPLTARSSSTACTTGSSSAAPRHCWCCCAAASSRRACACAASPLLCLLRPC